MDYSPEAIRTIALVGHAGCGKTSLAEALLHQGGALRAPGSVDRGTSLCDFDPLERKYRHSLNSSVAHLHYRDTRIFLIDTPGYPDFAGLSISALPAVETAAHVRVLESVVAHGRRGAQPPALTLLALLAWWQGDGARARLLLERALQEDPDYTLAQLLDATLAAAVPPGWISRPS